MAKPPLYLEHAYGSTQLQLPAATIKQTGEVLMPIERRRRVSVSLGKFITRLGKIAFSQLRHVFRHAIASDFKASGQDMDDCDLAVGLGHQSTRTQEHYGSANTARSLPGSRAQQVTQLKCSTLVRQPVRTALPSPEHTRTRSKDHPGTPTAD